MKQKYERMTVWLTKEQKKWLKGSNKSASHVIRYLVGDSMAAIAVSSRKSNERTAQKAT